MGLGDLFYSIGAIRFLATHFNEVRLVCKDTNKDVFDSLFHDLPNIKPIYVNHNYSMYNSPEARGCHLFLGGGYNVTNPTKAEYPYCFYDQMGLKKSILKDYFNIPRLPEYKELWEKMPKRYIFIHEESTCGTLDIFSNLQTDLLVLDPRKNHYAKNHPFYEKAQLTVKKPSPTFYIYIIENAEELHLVESCYIALAHQVDVSRVKVKKGYLTREGDSIKTFGIFQRD
jgi:hypothetical protein